MALGTRWVRLRDGRRLAGQRHHALIRWLRLVLAVEEQRIRRPAAHRPAVQPRVLVGDAPEGDAVDDVAVREVDAEQILVALRQRLLYRVGEAALVRIE